MKKITLLIFVIYLLISCTKAISQVHPESDTLCFETTSFENILILETNNFIGSGRNNTIIQGCYNRIIDGSNVTLDNCVNVVVVNHVDDEGVVIKCGSNSIYYYDGREYKRLELPNRVVPVQCKPCSK